MTRLSFSLPALAALFLFLSACATANRGETTLYDRLGGEAGVSQIVKGTLVYTLADPRIAQTFENSNVDRVERLLIQQICELTGGPCTYSGQTMVNTHRGLDLNSMHFNALVENMQLAMDDSGVPYRAQNQLLAILAPMHRDIVMPSQK
ncbi:group I truncated hemoglobin [Robiginitomaculum antarcticum]|uniref:group I truncated hemoglobin n=1 Tax=Robiginitomaculum antarcticum TaxID=437507 RepID=UPI00035F92D1|nr:group 1 truncated hemoglobin [Robiginitomaculum antarcticum]